MSFEEAYRSFDVGQLITQLEARGLDDGLTLRPRESAELRNLYAASSPIPGRPGWRKDGKGREWFSAAWL